MGQWDLAGDSDEQPDALRNSGFFNALQQKAMVSTMPHGETTLDLDREEDTF